MRTVLGPDAPFAGAFAAPLAPDAPSLRAVAASDAAARPRAELDELRRRPSRCSLRTDRIDPSKNIVRGFLAYDASARGRIPSGASGSCSSRC